MASPSNWTLPKLVSFRKRALKNEACPPKWEARKSASPLKTGTGETGIPQKTCLGKADVLLKDASPKIQCFFEAGPIEVQWAQEARVGYLHRLLHRPRQVGQIQRADYGDIIIVQRLARTYLGQEIFCPRLSMSLLGLQGEPSAPGCAEEALHSSMRKSSRVHLEIADHRSRLKRPRIYHFCITGS